MALVVLNQPLATQVVLSSSKANAFDPIDLMLNASPVVQLVLVLLVFMSIACWFIIGVKWVHFGRAAGQSVKFLDSFWQSDQGTAWNVQRLETIYGQLRLFKSSPLASVFRAGYVELAKAGQAAQTQKSTLAPSRGPDMSSVERALRRSVLRETTRLENLIPFLATTGSTAPFVGLFGTVWGIMAAFVAIAGQHNASLDVVAPGIAEALIATAVGLAAAIPAVMAYNYFVRRVRVLESEMDAFAVDLFNVLQRHFGNG